MIKVYLAGEIHTNWREELIDLCKSSNLDIQFSSPVTNHEYSDNCGAEILGAKKKIFGKIKKEPISILFEPRNLSKIVTS